MPAVEEPRTHSASEIAAIRQQLESLVNDDLLRTSRRSVAFLRFIVEETLLGRAEELKERTIGIHVFGKPLVYDTNADHTVRTAASELRKRLGLYYGQEDHRGEVKILLLPGSYVPQFRLTSDVAATYAPALLTQSSPTPPLERLAPAPAAAPAQLTGIEAEVEAAQPAPPKARKLAWRFAFAAIPVLLLAAILISVRLARPEPTMQQKFWAPLVGASGPVLIAVGDVPAGPPVSSADISTPSPAPAHPGPPTVPFSDMVTIARVSGILASFKKDVLIRREMSSSFADLREGPVVLIGAFNNDWSLRLTRELRFSLAMDPAKRVIYIRDRDHPDARQWQWSIDPHPDEKNRPGPTPLHDYALVSRVLDSDTGHEVVVIGGLYTYGTQAAGEFVSSPQMSSLPRNTPLDGSRLKVQIVLDTLVTDGTAGPPRAVAVSVE